MAHFFLWELWKFHEQFLIQYRAWKMIIICHAIDSNWSVNCVFLNSKLLWMSSQIVKLIHLILGWNNAIIRNQSSELRIEYIDHIYSMSLSHFIVHCGNGFPIGSKNPINTPIFKWKPIINYGKYRTELCFIETFFDLA